MTSHALPLILALGLGLAASPALAQESISKVNGSITAQTGQRYGKLNTVNGSIRVGRQVAQYATRNPRILGSGLRWWYQATITKVN